MSKLAKKFMLSISIVLMGVIFLTLFINSRFIERYYLFKKKAQLENISERLQVDNNQLVDMIEEIERISNVVIVRVKDTADNNEINENLRAAFLDKGLGIDKFWLWDKDYEETISKGKKIRIYNQPKLNYSLLVEYLSMDDELIGIAMVIPNVSEMIRLINWMTAIIFMLSIGLILCLIYFLVKRITTPLHELSNLTKSISNQNFRRIQVKTNDEVEDLAESFNDMSMKLQQSQYAILEKTRQMETLLGNVSHDLKTPISLIKAYTSGILDGLDDGTFLETIIAQNEKMGEIVEKLLELSKVQQTNHVAQLIDLSNLVNQTMKELDISMNRLNITCIQKIESPAMVYGEEDAIVSILMNLITNAIKYTKNQRIEIELIKRSDGFRFQVTNGIVETNIETDRLWEPFYVNEKSRNKELSGTGLGLSIVRAICNKYGYEHGIYVEDRSITFYVTFRTLVGDFAT